MAKPINLFQGPAPQAMAMMGQGLSEAGARIGQFEQQGRQALGEGLAQGLQGAAGAVSSLNTAKAANNVTKSIFGDENMFKMFFPEGTEDQRKTMLDSLNQAISRDGQIGGMQFSSQVMGPFLEQQRLGQQFQQQLRLAQAKMQKPDYSSVKANAMKEFEGIESGAIPLPSGNAPADSSIPLMRAQQGAPGANIADMLGGFLSNKYGRPVARPTEQDLLEFERSLQPGVR
jgi:hypothetical protein